MWALLPLEESLSVLLNVGNGDILLEHEKRIPIDTVTTTRRSRDTHDVRYDGESEFGMSLGSPLPDLARGCGRHRNQQPKKR